MAKAKRRVEVIGEAGGKGVGRLRDQGTEELGDLETKRPGN